MKALIRIPTVEYGYIEFEIDPVVNQTLEEFIKGTVGVHDIALKRYNGGFGLEPKEFNAALDRYLTDGTGETETYMKMSKEQQSCIQEIKKAFKRLETKNGIR